MAYPRPFTNLSVKGGAGISIVDMDVSGPGSNTTVDLYFDAIPSPLSYTRAKS